MFDLFDLSEYTFLQVSAGGPFGDTITESSPAEGVFKLRDGMNVNSNQETNTSAATLHIKPDEPYLADVSGNTVGHGIRKGGVEYKVIGQTGGDDFDSGEREFYRLTLERKDWGV